MARFCRFASTKHVEDTLRSRTLGTQGSVWSTSGVRSNPTSAKSARAAFRIVWRRTSLPDDANVAALIRSTREADRSMVVVCHGPAALMAAKSDDGAPPYTGYAMVAFPDRMDRQSPWRPHATAPTGGRALVERNRPSGERAMNSPKPWRARRSSLPGLRPLPCPHYAVLVALPMEASIDTQAEDGGASRDRPSAVLDKGDALGRYVVLRKLGAGGMGTVYLGYDPELDRKLALKLLRGETSEAGRRALQHEAQAMAKLDHPNVVAVHDVGEHEGEVYVAMAFVEGTTLSAWLRAEPRTWREIVDTFIAAGRGLAAAHARDLIHRDFKPDNVMVTAAGGVQVMDFGLARPSSSAESLDDDDELGSISGSVLTEATVGRIAGTPAYMAPEQLAAETLDAQADQFAFCVSLWQGLCGQRPFAGKSIAQLYTSTSEGRISPPPAGASMPRWLRRVLVRGLAPDPAARWPSMAALLSALDRGRRRWRWQLAVGVAVVLAIASAAALGWQRQQTREHQAKVAACEAEGAAIDEVWNDAARARLREGLLATGFRFAPSSVETLVPWLDDYRDAWRSGRTEACLHAKVERDWDADLLDRAVWCFEDRRLQLEATVNQIAALERAAARRAVRLASYLDPVEVCLDPKVLGRQPLPPTELRDDIRAIRASLVEVDRQRHSGHYAACATLAEDARARAEALGWPPLLAHAHLLEGHCLRLTGRYDPANHRLSDAYFGALEAGATEVAFRSARSLIGTLGSLGRPEEALSWSRHADLLARELADPSGLDAAEGHYVLVDVYLALGQVAAAIVAGEAALDMRAAILGREHPITAAAMRELAIAYQAASRHEEALELLDRAAASWTDAVGPQHPYLGQIAAYRAASLLALGRVDEALALAERAVAIYDHSLRADHPRRVEALRVLGDVHAALDHLDHARAAYTSALAIAPPAERAAVERRLAELATD